MKKINKTPLAAAMGAAFISTFAATAAHAEANPFGVRLVCLPVICRLLKPMQLKKQEKWLVARLWAEWPSLKLRKCACAGKKSTTANTKAADGSY